MDKKLKNILIEKILQNIPDNVKPVDYLSDVLDLGRDSIYRRLNGQIDFSLSEIIILSDKLGFSLDEIHCEFNSELAILKVHGDRSVSPETYFTEMFQFHFDNQMHTFYAEKSYSFIVLSRLLGICHLKSENLMKFLYFKWLRQFSNVPLNYSFGDLEDIQEIVNLCKKTVYYQQKKDYTIILDKYVIYNLIQEIKYYYERNLLKEVEVSLLRIELLELIEGFKELINTGKSFLGATWTIYLSSINISSNCAYLNYDDVGLSTFWVHFDDIFYSYDNKLCQLHKYWLESLKKYSTLITQSNQKMQAEFINQQYRYMEEL